MVRRLTSRRSLVFSSRISVVRPLALAAVDAFLAHPVAERLLDDAELSGHVRDRAVLVDHQGRRVSTELLWIPTPTPRRLGRFGFLLGHRWHDYLLFEVSGQRGDGQVSEVRAVNCSRATPATNRLFSPSNLPLRLAPLCRLRRISQQQTHRWGRPVLVDQA